MNIHRLFPFLLVLSFSCRRYDPRADVAALLALQAQQRAFHFAKDSSMPVRLHFTDFVDVSHGVVSHPSVAESVTHFRKYFDGVDHFIAWDDVAPPSVTLSDDGSMGWVVVQKHVVLAEKGSLKVDTT